MDRCPAKKPKLDLEHGRCKDDESDIENKLRQFDVLDEVEGDGSASEGEGNYKLTSGILDD